MAIIYLDDKEKFKDQFGHCLRHRWILG